MNENKAFNYEKKKETKNISYPKKLDNSFNAKKQNTIVKQAVNNQKKIKNKNNKNLLSINKNQKHTNINEKAKTSSDQKIDKSRNDKINKIYKETEDYNDLIQNKNTLNEKIIKNYLTRISNERNFKLRENQNEMLSILERLIDKIKNNINFNTFKDNRSDSSYKIVLDNFRQKIKSIIEKSPCEKSNNSFNCKNESLYNIHNFSKINESELTNELNTLSPNKLTSFQDYQTNSCINNNTSISQKINKSNQFFSKSLNNYPVGTYNNKTTCIFRNERSFISAKKNVNNVKLIFPEKKSSETRKITRSIIKTEKTLVLNPDTKIKPIQISEIKKKPITEIVNNPDGSKSTIIKNIIIKTITENKIVDVPEVDIVKNASKVVLVKQFTTKEYQTIISYINDNEDQINQTYDINSNKIIFDEINKINKNKNENDDTNTLNVNNTNPNTNTNSEFQKKVFFEDNNIEKINETDILKLSKLTNEQINKSKNKHVLNIKKNLPKTKNIKKKLKNNILISLPKKQNNIKNIFTPSKNISKSHNSLRVNKSIAGNTGEKLDSVFSNVKIKNKINFDMPEDIIDIKGLQKEDSLVNVNKILTNGNNNDFSNVMQKSKSPTSKLQNENKTKNLDEIIKMPNNNKKRKINKLTEFINEFNDSSEELNEEYDRDEFIEKLNKNNDIYNENNKNKFITEEEKMESSLQIIDENYNNMQANDQKAMQQEKEIKTTDIIASYKSEKEKNDNNENTNLIKESINVKKERYNSEGGNNNYMLLKTNEVDDFNNCFIEKNYEIFEDESSNNDFNKRSSIDNKRICINTQDIQLLNEKFKNMDNNEICSNILLNNNISSSEIDFSVINSNDFDLEISEFNKSKKIRNEVFQLKKPRDEKEKSLIQNEEEAEQNKFFAPLKKYECGFELNKKNPFN